MRATKGIWAALGAGTSLAAAGLITLATLGAVLAVGGWPAGREVARDGSVMLRARPAAAKDASARPAGAVTKRTQRARPQRARHATPVRRVALRGPVTRRHAGDRPDTAKVTAPAAATTPASPSGTVPSATTPVTKLTQTVTAPVTKVTQTVGSTVTNVTDTAGSTLDPVSPAVGQVVEQTGQQAGQVVDQVGQTVGGVLGGLTGSH